ncbi:MAG: hypothetical protein K8I00_02440 [Candidatus Omnitrophica bacterium]|nr:hypothetical protein [Candidatus Omnitrophota bacterium]
MEVRLRTPWFTGTYLVFIGLIWIINAGFFYAQRASAPMVYEAGQEVLAQARNGLDYLRENDPGNLTPHRQAYSDLQRDLIEFKIHHIDAAPLLDIVVSVLAVITALLYISAGMALFLRRFSGGWMLVRGAMGGVLLHYVLITMDFILTMLPINRRVQSLLDVFGVKGSLGVDGKVGLFVGGFALAALVFYGLFPWWLWRRIKLQNKG